MEAAEASAVHAEEFQKENLSVEKDGSFSNVDRTCNHCTLDVAIRRCRLRCRCREKDQQNGASFCRLNRQDSSAVDSFTAVDRAKEKLKLSSPNAAFSSVAKKQQESVTGFLPQTPKDLPERITLPPKKRTCLNMEINAQPSTIFGKEAFLPSNLAIPATFNSDNTLSVKFDPRNNLQREPHVEEASRKILVETSGSSAKYMKPSRLLLRRYKLLSEIV